VRSAITLANQLTGKKSKKVCPGRNDHN
jgi:hypothetical protein